ncbi:MAG: hypothetical protein H8E12_05950 [Rhodobacteraceae bacterium]|nr:hypothetical protein [Paracoccaceae bacterium]
MTRCKTCKEGKSGLCSHHKKSHMEELDARRTAYLDDYIPRAKFILPFELHHREAARRLVEQWRN